MIPHKKTLTLVLLGLITLALAQVDTAWTRRYSSPNTGGSSPTSDYSYGLAVDNDGNVIMTGGSDYLGNAPELLTIKYAPNGDTVWQRIPVRTGSQISRAVAVGATGNVYITGYTMETGNGDYITVKYSPGGTMAWAVLYNGYGTGYDFARKIAIDSAENIYVSGYTQGASSKYFIGTIKYNSSGSQQWVARDSFKGVSSLHYPADLALDYQGNPYVVSRTGPATASYDYVVAKYNPLTGDTLWVRYYNGTANGQDEARAITFDPDGNVYVTGTSAGTGTGFDIVTLKYDANGTLQWEKRFSNPDTTDGSDGGWWIAYDPAGYVYVYGHTQGLKATNYYDLVLIKYNALNGNEEWISYYNGPAGDRYDYPVDKDGQNGMALDQFGNIYVLGLTRQLEGPGTQSTENDFITVKFNSLGNIVWTARYNYADSLEMPYAIAVDNYNNVYVTGRSFAPNTDYDAVTIKYTQGAPSSYTITANAYGPGTIVPSGLVIVPVGEDTTFTITPNLHAQLDSLVVDGINHGSDSTTYRFEDVTSNHTIYAYFSYITYTITATAHDGGTITPSGTVTIIEGQDTTFIITPDLGHHLDSLVVDGVNHGGDSTYYTFEDVSEDHAIDAYFSINTYTITATASAGGTITPSGTVIVEYGADTTFYITPNPNYQIDSVLVDGVSVGAVTEYTFEDVSEDHTISAYFSMTGLPGWAQKAPIETSVPNAIKEGGALVGVDDELYAFVGTKTNKFKKYVISTNQWIYTDTESLPFGYKYPLSDPPSINKKFPGKGAALCYDGVNKIYATRGNGTREFWSFNLTTRTWTREESIPVPKGVKYGTALAFMNGKVYLLAGAQKKTDVNNFYVFDTTTRHWSTSAPLELGSYNKPWKDGSCLAVCDGQIYALKGGDKDNLFYAFDGNSWTPKETLPKPDTVFGSAKTKVLVKAGGCMASDGSVIYAVKGGGTDCFWKYTPGTPGVWEMKEPIPVIDKKHAPKTGAAMAYAQGKIWLLVGNKQPDFWCYTPSTKSVKPAKITSATTEKTTKTYTFKFEATPNPFEWLTTIRYTVPVSGNVSIKLYNASGRLIKTLVNEYLNAGLYTTTLTNIASGVYFLKYESAHNNAEVKLIMR